MFFPVYKNDRDRIARETWEKDKAKREQVILNPTVTKNFKEDSRALNQPFASRTFVAKSHVKKDSYDWEKESLHELPKEFGKSYNEKFANYTKLMGMGEGESESFRRFLDAREEGKLNKQIMNKTMFDMMERAKWERSMEKKDDPIIPQERGKLDRVFDLLLMTNYMSANAADAILRKDYKDIPNALLRGLKAGNPFGKGFEEGEKTYADVLEDHYWSKSRANDMSAITNFTGAVGGVPGYLLGKYVQNSANENIRNMASSASKTGTGLSLDIVLDPLTYVTFGMSAFIKGSGKASIKGADALQSIAKSFGVADDAVKNITKSNQLLEEVYHASVKVAQKQGMTVDKAVQTAMKNVDSASEVLKGNMNDHLARMIVNNQAKRTGKVLDEKVLSEEATEFIRKFHEIMGTNRDNVGLGIGFKHSLLNPVIRGMGFDSKWARNIANFHVEIPGSKRLVEAVANRTTGILYSKMRKRLLGGKIGQLFSTRSPLFKLAHSDPARVYDAVDFMNRTQGMKFDKLMEERVIREYVQKNLSDLSPSDSKKIMELLQDKRAWTQVKRVVTLGNMSEAKRLKGQLEAERNLAKLQLDDLEGKRKVLDQLREAKKLEIKDAKEAHDLAEAEYSKYLHDMDVTLIHNQKDFNHYMGEVKKMADELEEQYIGKNSPLKPSEPVLPDEPVKPTRPYTKNPKKPELEAVPDKPVLPDAPKLEDFVDGSLSPTHQKAFKTLEYWDNAVVEAKAAGEKAGKKNYAPNQYVRSRVADELSEAIYGEAGHISKAIYPYRIDDLVKLIRDNASDKFIRDYINANKHWYDGRSIDMYGFLAERFNYGSGRKHASWDELYTKPMEEIVSMMDKAGNLPPGQWEKYQKLELMRMERLQLLNQMTQMNHKELKRFIGEYRYNQTVKDALDATKREYKGRGFEDAEEVRRGKFTDEDRASHDPNKDIGTSAQDDFRYKETKDGKIRGEEIRGGESRGRKSGEFDDKSRYGVKLDDFEKDELEMLIYKDFVNTQWDKQTGVKGLFDAQRNYLNSVLDEVNPILEKFFKKPFSELSANQKNLLVRMAKQHSFAESRGQQKMMDVMIAKKAAEQKEFYEALRHAEAVRDKARLGSSIVFRNSDGIRRTGKITDIIVDVDDNIVYSIARKDGEVIHGVQPKDIVQVDRVKPKQLLEENAYMTEVEKKFQEATNAYNAEVKRLDEEYEALVKKTESQNAEKMDAYKEEMKRIKEVKAEKKAQYDAQMDEYKLARHQYELDKGFIEFEHSFALKDWEDAIRQSSDIADEYFAGKKAISDMVDEYNEAFLKQKGDSPGIEKLQEWMKSVKDDYARHMDDSITHIKRLEEEFTQLERQLQHLDEHGFDTAKIDARISEVTDEIERLKVSYKSEQDYVSQGVKNPRKKEISNQIDALNRELSDLKRQRTYSNAHPEELRTRFNELNKALENDEAWEMYVEMNYARDLENWDKLHGNEKVGELMLDLDVTANEKVRRIAMQLRKDLNEIGAKEVELGALTNEQFAKWADRYLPHMVTDEGREFFKKWMLTTDDAGELAVIPRPDKEKIPSITQDLGYGEMFSVHSLNRKINKIKLDDGTIAYNPTIEQINEVLSKYMKGKNVFSDNLADIYLTRMLKHNEIAYDERYMQEMMRTFGDDLPADFVPKQGNKIVMNFGLFRKNLSELSGLETSLHISEAVGQFVKTDLLEQAKFMPDAERTAFIEREIAAFLKREFPTEKVHEIRSGFHDKHYETLGYQRDKFRDIATPMVELSSDKAKALHETYSGVLAEYQANLNRVKDNAYAFGATEAQLERIAKSEERLANLQPLEIKQVQDSIVQRANQARELQLMKDKNRFLKLYDKIQHFFKLNQTVIMPNFHMRNAQSNMFQVWLAVGNDMFDFKTHELAFRTMKHNGDVSALKDLEPLALLNKKGEQIGSMRWDEIYHLAERHGVVNEGFFAKDIGAGDASSGLIKPLQNVKWKGKRISLDLTDTKNYVLYQKGSDVGSLVENQARLFQFASHLKQGFSPQHARDLVNKHLFDYSELTSFEMNVMKRIFPYYTWLRKNAKLELTQMLEKPGKYRDVAKIQNSVSSTVSDEDRVKEQYLSPFARDWVQTPFFYTYEDEEGNEVREPVLWNPNMPYMDINRLPLNPFDVSGNIKTMLPQSNPLIKGAVELGTNKNFFFDDKIIGDKDTDLKKAQKYFEYGASQLSPYTGIRDVFKKQGVDKALHLLNMGTGQKFLSYDYEMSKKRITDKALGRTSESELWVDKALNAMDDMPRKEQNEMARILDDYIGGKTLTKENTGKYYPFVSVMKAVGLEDAKTRQFVKSALYASEFEKYLIGSDFMEAKVVNVRDGDTVDIEINGEKVGVRFNLVDTPETVDPRLNYSMPYGKEASDFTKKWLNGKDVRLVVSKDKDHYDRYIAYVYVDGEDFNKKLLEEGFAQVRYSNLSQNPYRKEEYDQSEKDAYNAQKGLWKLDGYAVPGEDKKFNMKKANEKYMDALYDEGDQKRIDEIKREEAFRRKLESYQRNGW